MLALIQACSAATNLGIRNRVLIETLYRGGLRISDGLALRPKDVDLAAGSIRVLHGKGDKARTVGIDPGAVAAEHFVRRDRRRGSAAQTRRHHAVAPEGDKSVF